MRARSQAEFLRHAFNDDAPEFDDFDDVRLAILELIDGIVNKVRHRSW